MQQQPVTMQNAYNTAYMAPPPGGAGGYPPQQQQMVVPVGYPPQQQQQMLPMGYPSQQQQQQQVTHVMNMPIPMAPAGAMVPMVVMGGVGGMVTPGGGLNAPDMLSALATLAGIYISQDVSLTEVLIGCDTQNKYTVSAWNPKMGIEKPKDGRYGPSLFRFKERSNCLVRQLCGPRRDFKMAAFPDTPQIASYQQGPNPLQFRDAFTLERPFRCTFLCFWRSLVRVKHNTLGYIGEIWNPFHCLDSILHVRGFTPFEHGMSAPVAECAKAEQGKLHYVIRGELCQWGFWFPPLPCGPCSKIIFNIYRPEDKSFTRPVGSIAKIWGGCLREAFTVADQYVTEFPADATPHVKMLIMASVILLDFLWFETQEKQNDNQGGLLNLVLG